MLSVTKKQTNMFSYIWRTRSAGQVVCARQNVIVMLLAEGFDLCSFYNLDIMIIFRKTVQPTIKTLLLCSTSAQKIQQVTFNFH